MDRGEMLRLAEMIAKFRTPPGMNWQPLADDIELALQSRKAGVPEWLVRTLKCPADGRGFVGECIDRWGCNCSVGAFIKKTSAPPARTEE